MLDKYRETLEGHNKSVAELQERVEETKAAESALKKALSQAKKKAGSAEHSLQRAIKKAEMEKDAKPSKKSHTSSGATNTTNILTEDEEEGIAKARVSGVLDILRITADKRRSHLESKRHNNFFNHRTAWKDGEDDVENWPDSLKRSLVMRMQRRRVQITLRPSRRSILSDVKMELEKKLALDQTASAKADQSTLQDQALRAEQRLLLSLHPAEDFPRLPKAPKTSSSSERWAEPGWKLALDVPRKKMATSASALGILPSSTVASRGDPLRETLLSECLSAPGRQTALMMQRSHLRLLCNPLSDLSRASAPAETHPAGISPSNVNAHKMHGLGLDPMNVSEEEMLKGYSFVAKKRKSSASTSRKRTNSRGASKERKQGSGNAKKRRTSKATSSKKNKETSSGNAGATSSASKPKGTNAASGEKSHAPTSFSSKKEVKHPNASRQMDPLPQPPAPMQNFSSSQPAAMPNQNSRSSVAYSNSTSTSSPGHQRNSYKGAEVRTGNIPPFNEAQMAIPQPPPPPHQQQIQRSVYQQQQQQQQHQFYQQQQQQQMYFAAQQQAAASQQVQSPMQPQYQQMQLQGQPAQGYSSQAYPIHQMQGRGGPSSDGGQSQPPPPPPIMGQGMNMNGMPFPGASNPNDSHFQQERR